MKAIDRTRLVAAMRPVELYKQHRELLTRGRFDTADLDLEVFSNKHHLKRFCEAASVIGKTVTR